jgi:hypothetical protein
MPMQWSEDSDELAQAARFRDVTAAKRPDLSWARGPDPDASSLRPPRLPSLDEETGEPEEIHAPAEMSTGLSLVPPAPHGLDEIRAGHDHIPDHPPTGDPPPRRMDTMIDDIVPRAEEEAFAAIRDAVVHAEMARDRQFADAEKRLVDLALLVARRVIAREVSIDPRIILGLVREGMSALGERDRLVVRVGTFYREMQEDLQQQLSTTKLRCDVVLDPSLGRSGCIVETDLGRVDESIDARLETLIEAMMAGSKRANPG